jgi:hypothetical protein
MLEHIKAWGLKLLIRNPAGIGSFITVWLMFGVRYLAAFVGSMPYPQAEFFLRFTLVASFWTLLFMPMILRESFWGGTVAVTTAILAALIAS